jgi:hypothetical protein
MSNSTTPSAVSIPTDSKEDIQKFIAIIADAFEETALTTAFISEIDATPPPYPSTSIDTARRHRHFAQGILDSAGSGAELVQAGNWSAIALWEPPSYVGKPFIDSKARPGPLLSEWKARVKAAQRRCLAITPARSGDHDQVDSTRTSPEVSASESESVEAATEETKLRPFYHLSFLARNPSSPRVPGSINAVISPFLERARAENVPAWLEATTRQAATVYAHHGFRLVEAITIGAGKVDAKGWPKEGGEGVTAYAMIFDQHLRD